MARPPKGTGNQIGSRTKKGSADQISGRGGAAERLGLKRTTVLNKMKRLGIEKKDYAR